MAGSGRFSGRGLELPFVYATQPIPAISRRADPRVAGIVAVTQGVHVRPIQLDPRVHLISSADRPVTWDKDVDVARHALEQPQRGEVVLDRVGSVVEAEQRNQEIGQHVAGDENAAFLDPQRRVARGVRLMLGDPDLRAVPRNLRGFGGQAGDQAEQVQRYLLGDSEPARIDPVRELISGAGCAARGSVTGRRAEAGMPEQVVPMGMRREACDNGLARIRQVVREAGHFVAVHPGVDQQHAGPPVHDDGVGPHELALVDQHTVRDLPQHGAPSPRGLQPRVRPTRAVAGGVMRLRGLEPPRP